MVINFLFPNFLGLFGKKVLMEKQWAYIQWCASKQGESKFWYRAWETFDEGRSTFAFGIAEEADNKDERRSLDNMAISS